MNLPPDLRLTPKIAATIRNATAMNHSEGNRIATAWESITTKAVGVNHSEGRFRRRLWSSDSQRRPKVDSDLVFERSFIHHTRQGSQSRRRMWVRTFYKSKPQFPEL
ncbi:hypothetical protein LXL04_014746 [Taraxacum kok-saghyz]